jgi:hypothetical protein
MSQHDSAPVVVGVDVGGPKKGFHAVALRDGKFLQKFSTLNSPEVADWCRKLDASALWPLRVPTPSRRRVRL